MKGGKTMHHARIRRLAYWVCMAAAILLAVGCFLYEVIFPQPERYVSIHAAATVSPMYGFNADSLLNAGSAEELDALPGVGEVIAQRIMEVRQAINGYRIPEDLLLVKGIGEKTLDKIMSALPEKLVLLTPVHEEDDSYGENR